MKIAPLFPKARCQDPARQAELSIYEQLADSRLAGRALYEVRAGQQYRELDLPVFL